MSYLIPYNQTILYTQELFNLFDIKIHTAFNWVHSNLRRFIELRKVSAKFFKNGIRQILFSENFTGAI